MVAVADDSLIATAIRSYARLIKRRSRLVVAFWLVFLAATAPFAPGIFSATTQEFTPPPSSAAHQANAALQAQFPVAGRATQFVVLLSTRDGSSVLESADARAASDTLEAVARNHSLTHDVAGYYPLLKLGMRPQDLAPSFVSNSSSSTLIEVECSTYMTDQPTIDYLHWLEERVDELQAAHGSSLEVDLLGAPLIIEEAADTAMSDLEHMDAIVLPLSFAILAGVIGSFRLLLVPLLTIGVAAAGAFGITALIARATPIFTITPSLMMSILIAMSIDYALFLLTRFRQERLQGRSVPAAVEVTLQTAGMTVLVSGLTLAASFVALLFFPISVPSPPPPSAPHPERAHTPSAPHPERAHSPSRASRSSPRSASAAPSPSSSSSQSTSPSSPPSCSPSPPSLVRASPAAAARSPRSAAAATPTTTRRRRSHRSKRAAPRRRGRPSTPPLSASLPPRTRAATGGRRCLPRRR